MPARDIVNRERLSVGELGSKGNSSAGSLVIALVCAPTSSFDSQNRRRVCPSRYCGLAAGKESPKIFCGHSGSQPWHPNTASQQERGPELPLDADLARLAEQQ